MNTHIQHILDENRLRHQAMTTTYNPATGEGCYGVRTTVYLADAPIALQHIPQAMLDECHWTLLLAQDGSIDKFISSRLHKRPSQRLRSDIWALWIKERIRYDFEFWAAMFVKIKDKQGQDNIPFILNRPQRRYIAMLEAQRTSNKPIRLIMLKARQWGGSTITQVYMAWIQLVHCRNWNSIICAHLKDAAANIKGMYTKLLDNYPAWLLNSTEQPHFQPFERTSNTSYIAQRGCKITICSSESPEAVRGNDAAMAHLSEAAFWSDTPAHTPESLIRSIYGSIALLPNSMVVIESTANGTGGYFHREYTRACRGESDKECIFVPWYEIEMYAIPIDNPAEFASSLDRYEQWLWSKGATLEAIAWYRAKRREYSRHADMMAEYPSDENEAFAYSGERIFDPLAVQRLRKHCSQPIAVGDMVAKQLTGRDALSDIHFVEEQQGLLKIWHMPIIDKTIRNRYIVAVDVGGRSHKADYSVIAVFDRIGMLQGDTVELVAQWRGHIDHDLLAWKAAQIATFYNKALLVIESNTLETSCDDSRSNYILDTIASHYRNLYARQASGDEIYESAPSRWGFHMNRSTKSALVHTMINALRNDFYIEHDECACHEFDVFERKTNGSFGAQDGEHDDMLITRCMGFYIAHHEPFNIIKYNRHHLSTPINEASF
ncbi:MAG: hypothetical protein IKY75_02005 [Bacteroidaceae bacterium]|nr:hypothetical protein [Bacteroidaceae bacterium]